MAGRNVSYIKQDEPSFLKALKARAGYVEGPDIDTKRQSLPEDEEEEREDIDDEKPTVVVLKKGDLTEEEAEKVKRGEDLEKELDDEPPADGKIKFRKPVKRSSAESNLNALSSKKKKSKHKKGEEKKSDCKKVKNTNLLSFGDEEEEDEL